MSCIPKYSTQTHELVPTLTLQLSKDQYFPLSPVQFPISHTVNHPVRSNGVWDPHQQITVSIHTAVPAEMLH